MVDANRRGFSERISAFVSSRTIVVYDLSIVRRFYEARLCDREYLCRDQNRPVVAQRAERKFALLNRRLGSSFDPSRGSRAANLISRVSHLLSGSPAHSSPTLPPPPFRITILLFITVIVDFRRNTAADLDRQSSSLRFGRKHTSRLPFLRDFDRGWPVERSSGAATGCATDTRVPVPVQPRFNEVISQRYPPMKSKSYK